MFCMIVDEVFRLGREQDFYRKPSNKPSMLSNKELRKRTVATIRNVCMHAYGARRGRTMPLERSLTQSSGPLHVDACLLGSEQSG